MKYFFITIGIHSGEYEFCEYAATIAASTEIAMETARTLADELFEESDDIGVKVKSVEPISKSEFGILVRKFPSWLALNNDGQVTED